MTQRQTEVPGRLAGAGVIPHTRVLTSLGAQHIHVASSAAFFPAEALCMLSLSQVSHHSSGQAATEPKNCRGPDFSTGAAGREEEAAPRLFACLFGWSRASFQMVQSLSLLRGRAQIAGVGSRACPGRARPGTLPPRARASRTGAAEWGRRTGALPASFRSCLPLHPAPGSHERVCGACTLPGRSSRSSPVLPEYSRRTLPDSAPTQDGGLQPPHRQADSPLPAASHCIFLPSRDAFRVSSSPHVSAREFPGQE